MVEDNMKEQTEEAITETEEVVTEKKEESKIDDGFEKLKEEIITQSSGTTEEVISTPTIIEEKNEELTRLKEHNDLLFNELTSMKNMISELVKQKQPNVETEVKYTQKFEDLTQEQQADMLVYGKTFVGVEGKRIPPEYVVVDDNGEILYQQDEEEY